MNHNIIIRDIHMWAAALNIRKLAFTQAPHSIHNSKYSQKIFHSQVSLSTFPLSFATFLKPVWLQATSWLGQENVYGWDLLWVQKSIYIYISIWMYTLMINGAMNDRRHFKSLSWSPSLGYDWLGSFGCSVDKDFCWYIQHLSKVLFVRTYINI